MTVLEQLRAIYFKATQATIQDDLVTAIDLFKQLSTDEDREKAAVFMEGIAEMRREWSPGRPAGGGKKKPVARSTSSSRTHSRPAKPPQTKP